MNNNLQQATMTRKTKVSASGKSQTSTTKTANNAAKTFSQKNNGNDQSKGRYSAKPNLNVVSQNDLRKPYGIGVKTAESVTKYRKDNGPFQNFDELQKIRYIGPKRQEILQKNFTITDRDWDPSSSARSLKYSDNYYSTDPGKFSTNQNQWRTFSSDASSSIPVSRIAKFDETYASNFTNTSLSPTYNCKKNNCNDTSAYEKQHVNDARNKSYLKHETTSKSNYVAEQSTNELYSKSLFRSSAERSSPTFSKVTASTEAAVKPESESHLGWPTPETPNSSQNNPFQTFPRQHQLTPTPSAKTKTEPNEYDPNPAPQSRYDYELSKRQDILQQNFSTTNRDRGPSSRYCSSKNPEYYFSTNPRKISTNRNQAPSSTPFSRIAQFDTPHSSNFANTSSSSDYDHKKNIGNDTFTFEKQLVNDTTNKKHLKHETTPKPNYVAVQSTNELYSKSLFHSSAERSSPTFTKVTASTKAAVKLEPEPHSGWTIIDTLNSSKHNPSQTFFKQRHLIPNLSAKKKTEPNELDQIPAHQSHYDYKLSTEMRTIVPPSHESPYFTTEEFQSTSPTGMLFLHANIRSLKKNLKNVKNLIEPMQNSPDVIGLTDTKNPASNVNTSINGYSCCHTKTQSEAGGVAIYVKDKFEFERRDDLGFEMSGCENLWIDFTKSNRNVIVGVIYRHQFKDPGGQLFNGFKKHFQKTIEKVKKENKILYILGDLNCDFLQNEKQSRDYKDFLNDLGLKLLITKPTRVPRLTRAHHKTSLIDHIYTNDKQAQYLIAGIIETDDVSDHFPIFCDAPLPRSGLKKISPARLYHSTTNR